MYLYSLMTTDLFVTVKGLFRRAKRGHLDFRLKKCKTKPHSNSLNCP